MASHRRPKPASRTRVTVLTATAAAAVAISTQAAQAAPAKPTVKDAKAKVDALYSQAEHATETYNAANEKVHTLQQDASTLQARVARQQEHLNQLRDNLGAIAASQYRGGGLDPSLQLFLSSNPDNYLDQASALDQLGSLQAGQLRQLQDAKQTLDQERAEATAKLAELQSTRNQLAARKNEAKTRLAKAQHFLNSLTAAQRQAIQQQDVASAHQAANQVLHLGNAPAASGRAAAAFAAMKTIIGSPYLMGGSGPTYFDCSGAVQFAYRHAGVELPRTSQQQASAGTRIYSISQLKVGDMVFFYGLDHVGLYAGDGMVLHASHPGKPLGYEPMSDMPFDFGVRV